MNLMEKKSGCAFVLIEAHMFYHLVHGREDAQTGVAVGECLSASSIALIRIQVVIAVGRSRVPKAIAAISKMQYTARVHLKIVFQVLLHLNQQL